jgi:hypothetical protein
MNENMHKSSAVVILRWGLAFVFFYAAVVSLLSPQEWLGYLPGWLASNGWSGLLLSVFSIYQIILAALLFSGRKIYLASILSVATLAAITISNLGILAITFRDVGLTMSALALFELVKHAKDTLPE